MKNKKETQGNIAQPVANPAEFVPAYMPMQVVQQQPQPQPVRYGITLVELADKFVDHLKASGSSKRHEVRDKRRFIIVLDGLNERTTFPWADTLNGLAREAQALGGLVIITSRKAYWERDVRPRLESLAIRQMFVGDYDDQELAAVLKTAGRNLDDLSPNLKEFIRNPRICSVALNLLDRIDQPVEMTRERLLLEYWQARLKERGNGIAHTLADFKKLLQSHEVGKLITYCNI